MLLSTHARTVSYTMHTQTITHERTGSQLQELQANNHHFYSKHTLTHTNSQHAVNAELVK